MGWYLKVLKNYANFSGRARRKEYWMFTLFNLMIMLSLLLLSIALDFLTLLYGLYVFALILPSIAVTVRRLHDIGKSGWYYFVSLIPFIGGIWLLVLLCTEGEGNDNQYGPNPA